MKSFKIAVIYGDGIGQEVLTQGIKVLNKISSLDSNINFEFTFFPWSCKYYIETGKMMDDDGIEQLKRFDVIYLGAVGSSEVPNYISLNGLLLRIRKEFDQYINLRPVKLLEGAYCPLKDKNCNDIDMIVIRENTEGEYSGTGAWLYKGMPNEVVIQNSVFSRIGTERVIRYAFELARSKGKTLTSISKGNALNYSMVFWDEIFDEVSKDYPDVKTSMCLVDAASMFFVKEPERFQVVVCSNLFGDILTDLGAAIAGGMGIASSANINPEKKFPSMFEPIHGSAPDIAGKNIANPIAAIWSVSQMLEHLGCTEWADKVMYAIKMVMKEGKVLTPDLGGNAKTDDVGDAVCKFILSDQ